MNDPLRDALRRNALISGVLQEGYQPSWDDGLRARVRAAMDVAAGRRRLRRSLLGAGLAAAVIVALSMPSRAPVPAPPTAGPVATVLPVLQIVTTAAAAPVFEIVPTPSHSGVEVVHTAQLIGPLERARDEDLLAAGGVVGIVGHPGGARKLILVSPAPRRSQE